VDARTIAAGLNVGRAVVGGALLAAPARAGAAWVGPEATLPSTGVMTRAMGARDLGLALGTLAALRSGRSSGAGGGARTWLLAGVLADAADLAATLAAGRSLPPAGRNGTAVVAAAATATGLALALRGALR
jgi:hypothetical protein